MSFSSGENNNHNTAYQTGLLLHESNHASANAIAIKQKPSRKISRDEMNLAEFPLAVLSTRVNPKVKTLEFSDSVLGKNGNIIKRNWVITGADKFGLPTATDDEVLLGLLKLTVDAGLEQRKVFFTRYELLRILKWSTEGRSYSRLQNALDRLSGVRIKATNAFYDNETKSHSTKNFGIVDAYEINNGRDTDTRPSYFIWSEELFKSFQVGFIKKLDLDFYLDLKSAVSKRLYRYLDKHFWYKVKVSIDLFTLCHEKIGVSRNYKYASSLRQQLDPAVEELAEKGFLSGCEYSGRGKSTEVTFFAGRKQPRSVEEKTQSASDSTKHTLSEGKDKDPVFDKTREVSVHLQEELTVRGINRSVALKLVSERELKELQRMQQIVKYFDSLQAANSPRISKNPVGFLYKAVEKPYRFSLPNDEQREKLEARRNAERAQIKSRVTKEIMYKEYIDIRAREVAQLLETVEQEMLARIRQEAEMSLQRLKSVLSASRYREALDHAVEERLARLFALPTFDEWLSERQ